MKMVEKEEK